MPTSYEFLTFSDISRMRDASAKGRIRKHAMKDIGVSRRGPRRRHTEFVLELRPVAVYPKELASSPSEDHLPLADAALYNPSVRAMCCRMDPFDTASIPIDSTVNGLLRYFVYYSSNFPNNFTFSPCINRLVDSALQDDLLINCVLSAAASRVHYVQGVVLPPFRERELFSTQQSLKLLQGRLRENTIRSPTSTERLVNCMLYLGAAAIYREDMCSAKVHIDAAVKIVEFMGGVTQLQDPQVLVRVISLDDLLSCLEIRPCKVKKCTYDPGPLPKLGQMVEQGGQFEILPDRFLLEDQNMLPAPLRILALHVLECYQAKCGFRMPGPPFSAEALSARHWLTLRTLAGRNGLLAFTTGDARTNVLRIALIMCTLLPPSDPRQVRTAQIMAQKLRSILEQSTQSRWRESEQIKLLCLLIAYFSAREGSGTQAWFAEEICKMIYLESQATGIQAGPRLSEDLIAFQNRFLFHGPELKPLTEKLAQYVLSWNS